VRAGRLRARFFGSTRRDHQALEQLVALLGGEGRVEGLELGEVEMTMLP
jgi:hypothetical protein